MKKKRDKEKIVKTIIQAAALYKEKMVGRHFLYVFEGRHIETVFRVKDFMHLTGVDYNASAEQFYKDAVKGKLREGQIYFSQRHPYDLCARKISGLVRVSDMVDSEIFILKDATTSTFTYRFGLTDLAITLCLSEDMDLDGNIVGDHYIARSLRVEDSFDRAEDAFEVQYIFSKLNGEKEYNVMLYADDRAGISSIPKEAQDMLDEALKQRLLENQKEIVESEKAAL